ASQLKELLDNIQWRSASIDTAVDHQALEVLRQKISQLDDELLALLSQRMRLAEDIGQYKKDNNITILQAGRWAQTLENAVRIGAEKGLSKNFIQKYYDAIHIESINHQKKIMDS